MKVLITGAAGFIGSNLARKLIWRGDTVIGVDNFNDYYPRKCKEFNLDLIRLAAHQEVESFSLDELQPIYDTLKKYHQSSFASSSAVSSSDSTTVGTFHFYETDIVDFESLGEVFQAHDVDVVVHFAAMAGVPYSTKKPLLYTKVNVEGTVNLLKLSSDQMNAQEKTVKFLFASSSSVYGHRGSEHVFETDDVMSARSVYGASKVAGEVLSHSFHTSFGLQVGIMRIFGPIYGPLQRPYGMLHQRAINYLHNGSTLSIYGRSGLKTAKDATYIDDEVDGFVRAIDASFDFEVFNIGTANPLSIEHWLSCIEEAFATLGDSRKLNLEIVQADKADVTSSADISKAKKQLGYSPRISMNQGVLRQVEVFKLMPQWYQQMKNV